MSASYMNTNSVVGGVLGISDRDRAGEGDEADQNNTGEASLDEAGLSSQRAVVAAWLLVKVLAIIP